MGKIRGSGQEYHFGVKSPVDTNGRTEFDDDEIFVKDY